MLLLIAGAVTLGVVLGGKKGGGSDAGQQAVAQAAPSTPIAIAGPPQQATVPPVAASPPQLSSPPPAAAPPPKALPLPVAAPPASPPPAAPPTTAPAPGGSPPPAAAVPSPATPTSPSPSPSKSTYDPSLVAQGTLDGAPDGRSLPSEPAGAAAALPQGRGWCQQASQLAQALYPATSFSIPTAALGAYVTPLLHLRPSSPFQTLPPSRPSTPMRRL